MGKIGVDGVAGTVGLPGVVGNPGRDARHCGCPKKTVPQEAVQEGQAADEIHRIEESQAPKHQTRSE